ncbi:MAG: exonuclease domain-containing protein [Gemmobacter sp.]|nr:exonuclease domain-containing protein [Gemmobacter sp.]
MLERLSLRLRIFMFFALLALGGLVALGVGLWLGYRRLGTPDTLNAFVQGGLVAGFVTLGLVVWVWYLFDVHVAKAIERLAGTIRARAHSDVATEFDRETARYLGDLAPAVGAALASLAQTRNALAESVARETTRLTAEKARLEALLSDVPVGVLLCTGTNQLVFYNGPAQDLLGTGGAGPGLDRNLFDYLREGPVRHAHQRLIDTADPDAASDILCATTGEPRMLAARMRLIASGGEGVPGYVLTLRDVTADLAAHARREQLLAEVFDRVRRPAANLQTVMGVLAEEHSPDAAGALDAAMRSEIGHLTVAITELGARYDESRSDWWPLAMTRASDLMDSLRARLESEGMQVSGSAAEMLLRCNGFEIIALLADLTRRIVAQTGVRAFRIGVEEDGSGALITVAWDGAPLSVGHLDGWLAEPLEVGVADVTGRSVLSTHATEIWPESAPGTARICLPIRQARRAGRRPKPIARAVVYDFDLLSRERSAPVADTPLDQLTYVVFDTETTGLLPGQGDEIVQIAAVRLVNGRRVEGEVFDSLVNPGRHIPPASTDVHGITDAMVAEAEGVLQVLPRFHRFGQGAVLIAHNAPFDMTFLRRREAELGLRFDHPILDTVLLSAVVFGQSEVHSLDALTHRLGITIPEEARHTALGDTVATAEAFAKLLPMLQARGLHTFGDVLAEVRRHGRLLKDANLDRG